MYTTGAEIVDTLVPEFNSLVAKSQSSGKPVFELDEEEAYSKEDRYRNKSKQEQFEDLFSSISNKIISISESDLQIRKNQETEY